VAFKLDGEAEAAFKRVVNKPEFVGRAIEFYFRPQSALAAIEGRLASIETRLASGPARKSSEAPGRAEDDTEDKIDSLIRKTLAF
jgi:hypothetical protein